MWEGLLAVIVDLATFGLAALGGYVALKPPKEVEVGLRRLYFASFIALALIGISANLGVRHVDEKRRTKATADLTEAQNKFSGDLKSVERKSDSILSFVTNPPKGVSIDQAVAFARVLISKRNASSGKFDNMSNARVSDMARAIAVNVRDMADTWRADEYNQYMNATDSICYGASYTPQGCKDATAQWAKTKENLTARWQEKVKDLVSQANECRVELLNRLVPLQKNLAQDDTAKSLYEKMIADSRGISPETLHAGASYLDNLWKRLP